ncbi:MAG: non-heme iron oxygenase ferredoxin subunit [Chromatiales bacterium]|jgi:3-phenylpropionate/trans-cinnamate dioxygenase ferredoxin subunit
MEEPFVAAAEASELAPGQMKTLELEGRRILLANAGGSYYAVDEMCSHEDYSLALGCIKGRLIKCSLHGSYFDLATGEPTEEPASEPIRTYPVRVEDGRVWIDPS